MLNPPVRLRNALRRACKEAHMSQVWFVIGPARGLGRVSTKQPPGHQPFEADAIATIKQSQGALVADFAAWRNRATAITQEAAQ